MNSTSVNALKELLQKQMSQIDAEAAGLRSELGCLDDDLFRIGAAIAALDGTPHAAKAGKNAVGKQPKKNSQPSASKADVIKFVKAILIERGIVEVSALRALVEAKATEAGFTRMGLSLRFKEALTSPQFVDTPAGIRLKTESTTSGTSESFTIGTSTSNGTSSSSSGHTTSHTKSSNQSS